MRAVVFLVLGTSFMYTLQSVKCEDGQGEWNAWTIPLRPGNVSAVQGLLNRLIPEYKEKFLLELDYELGPKDKDTFVLESVNEKIILKGNTAVALSMGLHYYLKYYCKAHVSWSGDQLRIPKPLPKVQSPVTISSQDKFRHYQNVCTFSYSTIWWDWSRWEREIDWMALNGINLPLAFVAQEAIWKKVFTGYGFTDNEIDEFFTGPAFLAWNRMGNMQGFGGPLSQHWHDRRIALQKLILQRMREFGMRPVAPAFAGRVLPAFQRIFPSALVTQNAAWGKFKPPYCCTTILDPEDPLFVKIGTAFLEKYGEEFGIDNVYSADLFNEMDPPTSNTSYLRSCGEAVFKAMTNVDRNAVWVMQGWVFVHDPVFWKPEQAKSLLTSVPLGKMIVLDLEAEFHPQFSNLESFYGQPFIWSMIHNYGGVEGLYGSFDAINEGPFKGRSFPNSTMIGTGLTPEGIERNDVIYDLMNEMAWRDQPANISEWIYNYTERRYGFTNDNILKGWKYLQKSVYNATGSFKNHGKYIFNTRPSLSKKPYIWYDPNDLVQALRYLLQDSTDSALFQNSPYEHDIVDIGRQGCQFLLDSVYFNLTSSYRTGDLTKLEHFGNTIQNLLGDMRDLLFSDPLFRLDTWLKAASSWASSPQEELLFEFNARNQITFWGPNGEISDYANKQWSGIVSCYIMPRWDLFVNMLKYSLIRGLKFDQNQFNTMVLTFVEEPFSYGQCTDSASRTGDPKKLATTFLEKYGRELDSLADLRTIGKNQERRRKHGRGKSRNSKTSPDILENVKGSR